MKDRDDRQVTFEMYHVEMGAVLARLWLAGWTVRVVAAAFVDLPEAETAVAAVMLAGVLVTIAGPLRTKRTECFESTCIFVDEEHEDPSRPED